MENNMEYNNNNETSIYLLVTTTQHMMNTYCLNEPKNKSMVNIILFCVNILLK